jgi:hypothetical protein
MIYDGHAYCHPDIAGAGGFEDPADFRRHLQLATAGMGESLPPWRASDRAPADTSGLADLSNGWCFSALKDADFRPGTHGRFKWTVKGKDDVKQLLPPGIAAMSYPAAHLVADMDYAWIARALLQRTPYLGVGNYFVAECARMFPDRIQALAHVEEWLIFENMQSSIDKVDRAVDSAVVRAKLLGVLCHQGRWKVRGGMPGGRRDVPGVLWLKYGQTETA